MTSEILDLSNTGSIETDCFVGDGVAKSKCDSKQYEDVLYIPQKKSWYLISQKDADEFEKVAADLDAQAQPFIDALYSGLPTEEMQEKSTNFLKALNSKGVLENYKTLSHSHFLDEADKKVYAQSLYAKVLLENYIKLLTESSTAITIEDYKGQFDQDISHYALKLGLSAAELSGDSPEYQAIHAVAKHIVPKKTRRPSRAWVTYIAGNLKRRVLPSISNQIKLLDKKARDEAKAQGYRWYKLQSTQNYRFVKREDVNLEKYYSAYKNIIQEFRLNYQKDAQLNAINQSFQDFSNGRKVLVGVYLANVFQLFSSLNELGIAVPEQVLSREELFAKNEDTQTMVEELCAVNPSHSGESIALTNTRLQWGRDIKDSVDSIDALRYDSSAAPKSLSEVCSGEAIEHIESLGYFNLLRVNAQWDKLLTNYIKYYIEHILNHSGSASGYAQGGFYFLVAIRYQIRYLQHCARENLKKDDIQFCSIKSKGYLAPIHMPLEDIAWSPKDVQPSTYKFAWKESDSHIVEFFLMSQENKPRYMPSSHLTKLNEALNLGLATPLNLKAHKEVATAIANPDGLNKVKDKDDLKKQLKGALTSAKKAAKTNVNGGVSLNADIPEEKFTEYTSLIQFSNTIAGGKDMKYTVTAQADLLRFTADSLRFESEYPTSFEELHDKMGGKNAQIASLDTGGSIDLVAGYITCKTMLPNRNGFPLTLPTITEQAGKEAPKYFHIGNIRSDTELTLTGSAGVGFALASRIEVSSIDAGVYVQPLIPSDTAINIPTGGSAYAKADLFAGVRAGQSVATEVKWCKPDTKKDGSNWVALLDQGQKDQLQSEDSYTQDTNTRWTPLGKLCEDAEYNLGIGIVGTLQFGVINRKFVLKCAGGITFGVGGRLGYAIELYPETLLDMVEAFTQILANEDFRRIEAFTEKGITGSYDGFKVLNTLITSSLIVGLDLSQIALLDITELFREEDKILVRHHGRTIARQINDFFDNNSTLPNWVSNIPPETKARLLYALVPDEKDTSPLTPDLLELISKRVRLKPNQKTQLESAIEQEVPRWIAIAHLLTTWANESFESPTKLDRQIEETLARFNLDGRKMMNADYGNKIMPVVVWERIRGFIDKVNTPYLDETIINLKDPNFEDGVELVQKTISRFDNYFKVLNDFEQKTLTAVHYKTTYYIFTGGYRVDAFFQKSGLSDEATKFAYYHLARKQVFPQLYKDAEKDMMDIFQEIKGNPTRWLLDELGFKEELDSLEKAKAQMDAIEQAVADSDYLKLFELLGEQQ